MEQLQAIEIGHLQRLQHAFGDYSETMLFLSHLGDPRSAYLVSVPLAYCLARPAGLKVLWAAVMSEWLNLVLKWLLNGHRPYWWVHESQIYEDGTRPVVKQYRLTCETGPGVPSGHAMVTTAVWFIMMSSLAKLLTTRFGSSNNSFLVKVLCKLPWLFLAGLASVVCISRVFIATHFTHQVLLGVFVGILLGLLVSHLQVDAFSASTHVTFGITVVMTTLLQSRIMTALNFDPAWPMTLALKWCERREWVHLDTTPLYCIARNLGSLTMVAVSERIMSTREIACDGPKVVAALTSLILAQLVEMVKLPTDNVSVFYALGAVKYGAVIFGVIAVKQLFCYSVKNKNC